MRITVKGIYSTGLINLLLKEGFELTKLSDVQKTRFGIHNEDQYNISIRDLKDRTGISIYGENPETVVTALKKYLWDSLYLKKSNNLWYVIFGGVSKKILDEFRKEVVPTITNHHILRRDMSALVDFCEILLKYTEEEKIRKAIKEFICEKIKNKGVIKRYHRKLDGTWFSKIEVVEKVSLQNGRIVINAIRVPKPGGIYDGIGKPIEPGDYIKTTYIEDNWFFLIKYYSKEGDLKGIYCNINTPLEITSKRINYIDLCVDIVKTGSDKKVIDIDELNNFYESGYITEKLYSEIKHLINELEKDDSLFSS